MLEAAYYLLYIFCVVLIGWGFRRALQYARLERPKAMSFLRGYWIFIGIWTGYLFLITTTAALDMNARPPRLPLLVLLPIFTIIAWFFTGKKFKPVINNFPKELMVYYQSFRIIVEILIFGAYLKGLGPVHATFDGYNFDILAGITAPVIGWLAFNRKAVSNRGLLIWNILCLLLLTNIVTIFITLVFAPGLWDFMVSPVSQQFFTMPYVLIAAFYMPSAVFMHIFSINRILKEIKAGRKTTLVSADD